MVLISSLVSTPHLLNLATVLIYTCIGFGVIKQFKVETQWFPITLPEGINNCISFFTVLKSHCRRVARVILNYADYDKG